MQTPIDRRAFLGQASLATAGLALSSVLGEDKPALPKSQPHTLTLIEGKPRERGRQYGSKFKDQIHAFLDKEIYRAFAGKAKQVDMLNYAAACSKVTRASTPIVYEELEGIAQGADVGLEELVLITLHEELWHKGVLPSTDHCTAVAIGPPDTTDGDTFVGQTWDWMQSVFNLSTMLHWKRPECPSLLAYGYPGLWVGAGLNSAGLALCWTSAGFSNKVNKKIPGPRVGVSSYLLLTHLLYQESLTAVAEEARRIKNAGWFTFVMADGQGNLANIEGSPEEVAVEMSHGRLARVDYGSRRMTGAADGAEPLYHHARTKFTLDRLAKNKGELDGPMLEKIFEAPKGGICQGKSTIDMMVFNTTKRIARVSRGSTYGTTWRTFRFDDKS
jgi:isopenicillin-N N-acyltransferase-like protein